MLDGSLTEVGAALTPTWADPSTRASTDDFRATEDVSPGASSLAEPDVAGPSGFPANVLVNNPAADLTPQDTQSETTLVVFDSTVVVAFNDSGSLVGGASKFTGYSRSTDNGESFTDRGTLPTNLAGDGGDPVLARSNLTGTVFLSTLGFTNPNVIQVFRSFDGGQTFTQPVNAAPGRPGGNLDKEWMAVDNFPGPGQGNVYLIVRDFGTGNGIFLFRSTNDGATWGPSGGIQIVSGATGNVQGAWVVVGPDHSVYAFWFDETAQPERIRMRKSTDQGLTFGPPVTVATLGTGPDFNGNLGLEFRTNAFPQAVVNPVNGHIYVIYNDNPLGADRADIFFRQSTDGGATWGAAVRVNDDATTRDQWQPSLAVTPDGTRVGVFWYDRRNDPGNRLIDYFGAIGVVSDTAVAFRPNVRINDESFPPVFGMDPAVNPAYMGDYDQAQADNDLFYFTWADNRLRSLAVPTRNQADVRFATICTDVIGPQVTGISPLGNVFPLVTGARVTFNKPIDVGTLGLEDFALNGPGGFEILVTGVTPVPGTGNRQFDVTFLPQRRAGSYSVTVGSAIADAEGNLLDQNLNCVNGEATDRFTTTFGIRGPRITAVVPANNLRITPPVGSVRVTFDTPMDPLTFTPVDVALAGPGGPVSVIDVVPVAGTNDTQFDIRFATQAAVGTYTLVVGPIIRDRFYNPMDQDSDLVPGEVPDDQLRSTFGIFGPRIIASTPTTSFQPIGSVRVTFNVPIDVTTFTTADVVLTGPGGQIPVTDVVVVAGTNDTQFDIRFATQAAVGTYTLVVGPDIRDRFGNAMDQDNDLIPGEVPADQFRTTFTVRVLVPYQATAFPFENTNLEAGQPGVFTIITFADFAAVPVNLGSNTFNFYGVNYTGNNQLFVSSKGLITFGSANTDFSNSDLTTTPPQAAIAPLWDDWIKTVGSPMVVGRFDDLDGNGTFDRLIIEWNDVLGFPSSPSGVTFQAILGLNTSSSVPGSIIFNYLDLDSGDFRTNGANATVGIKDINPPGSNRVLISFNSITPLVGSGRAVRLSVSPVVAGDEVPTEPQPIPPPSSEVWLGDLVDLAIDEDEAPELPPPSSEVWLGDLVDLAMVEDEAPREAILDSDGRSIYHRLRR